MFWHQQVYTQDTLTPIPYLPACGHSGYTVTCKVWRQQVHTQNTLSTECFCTCIWIPRIHYHMYVNAPATGHPQYTVSCMLLFQQVDTQDTQLTNVLALISGYTGYTVTCMFVDSQDTLSLFHMYVLHQQVDTQDTLSYECYFTSKLISKIHFHMRYCSSKWTPKVHCHMHVIAPATWCPGYTVSCILLH